MAIELTHRGTSLMTNLQVEAFVSPSSDTMTAVNEFLSANGLKASPVSPAGDIVSFSVPVSQANEMFNADFSVFIHQASGEQTIRTLSHSVPSVLTNHIQFIHPTTACVS
jgi:tripeptidyl-peptidase I